MNYIFTLLSLLTCTGVGVFAAEPVGTINIGMTNCVKLISDGKINESMNEIRKAINCSYFDEIESSQELLDKVSAAASSELARNKKSAYYVVCAVGYIRLGTPKGYKSAMGLLNAAEEVDATLAEIYNTRGILYGMAGNNALAIKDYSKAIELNPRYLDALDNRCQTYNEIGRKDLALQDQIAIQGLKNSIYYVKADASNESLHRTAK